MDIDRKRRLTKPLLYALVTSVILGAILGILIVLRGTWGWYEVRVILTTIVIAVASLGGLACDLSRTPRGANLLPIGGLVLTLAAAGLILLGMWSDFYADWYWKTTATTSIFAVATVHVCLLSIARLARRFRWVFLVACQVIFGLALLLSVVIVGDFHGDRLFRVIAAVAIVDAALTLSIPLLHRISKSDAPQTAMTSLDERNVAAIDEEIAQLEQRIADLRQLRGKLAGG
ncbi:MAG: hypothetical protein ACOY3P_26540 [Planctomycetota bacterium]